MSNTGTTSDRLTCAPSRAARELGLKRGEFDLAVNLGLIRTVRDEGGGGPRVALAEIDRLRSGDGFPDVLRDRVATVGTTEGAKLLEVAPTRFMSLARYGLLIPVKFYLNRYRAVVWLYLAEELRQFAAERSHARLLTARRTPLEIRDGLKAGMDRRPRNWRGRHVGFLVRQAGDDPWARAAAVACLLDPADVADALSPAPPAGPDPLVPFPASPADSDLLVPLPAPPTGPDLFRPLPTPPGGPDPLAPPPAPAAERPAASDPTPPHGVLSWLLRRRRRPAG